MKNTVAFIIVIILLSACSNQVEYLPEELLGYKLENKLTGEEAKMFVNRLHFNDVTNLENEIGFYSDAEKELIIYITFYENQDLARQDELKMTKKISPQNSVFLAGKYIEIGSFEVYQCYGMGQAHYVFSKDGQLFWISVDSVTGKEFVQNYLKIIE